MRAGGDEQAVVVLEVAIVEQHGALVGVERDRTAAQLADAQALEMVRPLAQPGARLVDVALEQVGNGHARVRWRILVADHDDLVARRGLAQGFGGDDPCRAVAENQVFHQEALERSAGAPGGARVRLHDHNPRRARVSAVGSPPGVHPRTW